MLKTRASHDVKLALFIYQVCQQLPEYGVFFHRVTREKKSAEGEIILGVCAKGVMVYEVKGGCRSTSQNFYWRETATISSNVSKAVTIILVILGDYGNKIQNLNYFFYLLFQRRKFVVETRGSKKKHTFVTESSKVAKYLCDLCSAQHKFNNEMNSRQLSHSLTSGDSFLFIQTWKSTDAKVHPSNSVIGFLLWPQIQIWCSMQQHVVLSSNPTHVQRHHRMKVVWPRLRTSLWQRCVMIWLPGWSPVLNHTASMITG